MPFVTSLWLSLAALADVRNKRAATTTSTTQHSRPPTLAAIAAICCDDSDATVELSVDDTVSGSDGVAEDLSFVFVVVGGVDDKIVTPVGGRVNGDG